jgi:predicted nucleotidyltransferase
VSVDVNTSIAKPLCEAEIAINAFFEELSGITTDDGVLDFCRRSHLHGTPKIFERNEAGFYSFRNRIAQKFGVYFREVFIMGSAKLGFSPIKKKIFDYDSDIDVAIVSSVLFDKIMELIYTYQTQLRLNRRAVTERELVSYHRFLEYTAIGWVRPDLLPTSFKVVEMKNDWFDFFKSISYGKSEIGDYKVSAGVFKNYDYLERYTLTGVRSLQSTVKREPINVAAD